MASFLYEMRQVHLVAPTSDRPFKRLSGYPHDDRADKDSYPHDCRADKNPYRHDRHMRFSSKLNYALFSILMVIFF